MRYPPAAMFVALGNTYCRALPLLLRLQLERLTELAPLLYNSTQSELVVVPLMIAPRFSAITSLSRMAVVAGRAVTKPGEPLVVVERQFEGSSGSPLGLVISSE